MSLRIRTWTPFVIIAVLVVMAVGVRVVYPMVGPPLMINYTDSEPHGLYWLDVHQNGHYGRGQMVAFPVPEPFKELIYGRGWLARGLPLMKEIGALEGDRVCVDDAQETINGKAVGPIFSADSAGRPMPTIRGCYTVAPGYFLPLSTLVPKSFDGRYMGPQPLAVIKGEARSLWTF